MEQPRDQHFLLRPRRPHPIRAYCLACCLRVLRETSVLTRPNENIGNNTLPLPVSLIMYMDWIVESLCRLSAHLMLWRQFHLPAVSCWVGFASDQRKPHLLLFSLVCVCSETLPVQCLVFFSIYLFSID